jgi:hypothetical protein
MDLITLQARAAVYEGAGDTVRVYLTTEAPWTTSAMREARLSLDAQGFLVAIELIDNEGPRALIVLGPPDVVLTAVSARVLQMATGEILVTMGMKRVRGHERNPYVLGSTHPAPPT